MRTRYTLLALGASLALVGAGCVISAPAQISEQSAAPDTVTTPVAPPAQITTTPPDTVTAPTPRPTPTKPAPAPAPTPAKTPNAMVTIQNFTFTPATVTVSAGSTVVWTNHDAMSHTVTADDKSFESGNIAAGASYTQTFTTAGTFTYHCAYHNNMKGTLIVTSKSVIPTKAGSAK